MAVDINHFGVSKKVKYKENYEIKLDRLIRLNIRFSTMLFVDINKNFISLPSTRFTSVFLVSQQNQTMVWYLVTYSQP